MANKFQITITAVDKATARVKAVKQIIAKYSEPITKLKGSFSALGREVGLPKVAGAFRKIGVAVGDVYRKVMSLVAPMAAIIGVGSIGGLALLATGWSRMGQAAAQSAAAIGISASQLTQYQGAARLAGVSSESLTSSMRSFGDTMEDALYGRNQQAVAMLMQLGIRLQKTRDGAVDSTRAFDDLADAIAAHSHNPQAQNFIARQFGLEALLPMLRKGRAGVEELKRTVRAYGAEMSGPQARVAQAFQLSLTKTRLATDGLWNSIMERVLPIFSPLLTNLANWVSANRELIATKLEGWAKDLAEWLKKIDFTKLADSVSKFAQSAANALDSVGGFKGLLIGLAAITLAPVIGGILSLATAIVSLGSALGGLAVGTAAVGASKLALLGRAGVAGLAAWAGLEGAKALGLPETDKAKGEEALRKGDWWGASKYLPAQDFLGAVGSRMLGRTAEAATLPQSFTKPSASELAKPMSFTTPQLFGSRLPRGIRNHNPGNLRPNGDQ